jgi:hypothetical protein
MFACTKLLAGSSNNSKTNTARVLRSAELRQKTSSSADGAETDLSWLGPHSTPRQRALAGASLMYANRSGSFGLTLARSAGMANRMLIHM